MRSERREVVKWNVTLRKYLELLVVGGILERRSRNVGSVFPMELYRVKWSRSKIQVGLSVLTFHGLNWEFEKPDAVWVQSDLRALVRSTRVKPDASSSLVLAGCLEDCIAYELRRDLQEEKGTVELLAAMIGSKRLDLPYLFERADRIGIGQAVRALYRRISSVFSSSEPKAEARAFLIAREAFLKLARQYSSMGIERILDERGKGSVAVGLVVGLTDSAIVTVTAKQLGLTG